MLTERDKNIIYFIESIGFSSIQQIQKMFFNTRYGYDCARKRLKKLADSKSYIKCFKNCDTNEYIYIPINSNIKKVSLHNLKILDYICELHTLGCKIKLVELEPVFINIKPDALINFEFNGYSYYQLIEVQMRHSFVDINRFSDNQVVTEIYNKCDKVLPRLIIIQDTNKDYNKNNDTQFDIVQLYTDLSDIAKVLC